MGNKTYFEDENLTKRTLNLIKIDFSGLYKKDVEALNELQNP